MEKIKKDAVIEEDIFADDAKEYKYKSDFDNIFLTGATGFVGSFLLCELLKKTRGDIFCLVRAPNKKEAKQKLINNLKSFEIWEDKFNSRLIPLVGDLSEEKLGLSKKDFHELSKKIEVIYHSGARVNFFYPYSKLKPTNVSGTREIIKLAALNQIKPIHFLSSLNILTEATLGPNQEFFTEDTDISEISIPQIGYLQTKWVAEKILLEARRQGIPVSIYRISRVLGDSKTGVSKVTGLWKVIKGCIQLGYLPKLETKIDLIPVDYLCRIIVYLSKQKSAIGKTYHTINPNFIRQEKIMDYIISYGYPATKLPFEEWETKVKKNMGKMSRENSLYEVLPLVSGMKEEELEVKYTTSIKQDIASADIECPEIDYNLFETYFDYFVKQGYLDSV